MFYNSKSYGMLLPLDVNVNCRVRRSAGKTEIVTKDTNVGDTDAKDNYRGGSLFGGEAHDEL